MPKRQDFHTIALIGAGPIVIGQACEFDYSGTQALKALKEEGYRVVLINSNPATIMTDPELADATYIEPIRPDVIAQILEQENVDALLPTMGGQTALNNSLALAKDGTLDRLGITLIGASPDAIEMAEDREKFREAMSRIGLSSPKSYLATNMEEAWHALEQIGLPTIIRPSFTLGGSGGGIAYNRNDFEDIVKHGLSLSPVRQVLIEQSLLGWKEFEMEVVRDHHDNCIIVCTIENMDPMGVHTGDSITVAPAQTLTDKEYQRLRDAAIAILREIGVETGGSNVQFAVNPANGEFVVIEMNPRVSRSSALASKATGFPIAKVAAKLAVGYTLDELINDMTGTTPASFEPSIDYVVTKIPRFAFDKFPGSDPLLTTAMKSVGETMAIGSNFSQSLQKALRSLETGLEGLDPLMIAGVAPEKTVEDKACYTALRAALARPVPERILVIAQALRHGMDIEDIHQICAYDLWFLRQIAEIVAAEQEIKSGILQNDALTWRRAKEMGFSDAAIARLTNQSEDRIRAQRQKLGVEPIFRRIDSCAGEFPSATPYLYSSYIPPVPTGFLLEQDESAITDRRKIIVLGGGPNRIGQGIEFDYCCVHAATALSAAGYETIMINCNPETVSTDYDTADRLYFEPLTVEDVLAIIRKEQKKGQIIGVIVQFGGQTPLKLAQKLASAGVPILGTPVEAIHRAEDRGLFTAALHKLGLQQPAGAMAHNMAQAQEIVERIGYPVVIRPSYVLGGQAMQIIPDKTALQNYIQTYTGTEIASQPLLIDSYVQNAVEIDVDALCDGKNVKIMGLMEHIEEAGIHSGDSACTLPARSISETTRQKLTAQTTALARELKVQGLINIQFALKNTEDQPEIYILEANPRASRTVPFVAKTTGIPVAAIAARIMAGERLEDLLDSTTPTYHHIAVKEAVFPFTKFPGSDILLGPEMRSTGEVMGIDNDFGSAFAKAQWAAGQDIPTKGTAFISVKDSDKHHALSLARDLSELGFSLISTRGTWQYLKDQNVGVSCINKVLEGSPHIVDSMINGEVDLVINTTQGAQAIRDSVSLRRTALLNTIPYFTTIAGARAAICAIKVLQTRKLSVRSLQSYLDNTPASGDDPGIR